MLYNFSTALYQPLPAPVGIYFKKVKHYVYSKGLAWGGGKEGHKHIDKCNLLHNATYDY